MDRLEQRGSRGVVTHILSCWIMMVTNDALPTMSAFDRIELKPYSPEWPAEYGAIVALIRPAFAESVAFHHIGSTSVTGLAAKDIIDIQASVTTLDDVDASYLLTHGFVERPIFSDHPPAGRNVPPDDLRKRFFRGMARPSNLHVRLVGKFNQRYPILCRDYLRTHRVTSASYQIIKEHLLTWFPEDIDRYYDVKDPLFDIIMDGAENWACLTGWHLPPPDYP
jgi:GrpB-like predicted nucleotidyltransferase (UPF0157 family)